MDREIEPEEEDARVREAGGIDMAAEAKVRRRGLNHRHLEFNNPYTHNTQLGAHSDRNSSALQNQSLTIGNHRSARLSDLGLPERPSSPVPFSSSSLAVSEASESSSSRPSNRVFSSSPDPSRSTVSPCDE